jgi:hypothetical protein
LMARVLEYSFIRMLGIGVHASAALTDVDAVCFPVHKSILTWRRSRHVFCRGSSMKLMDSVSCSKMEVVCVLAFTAASTSGYHYSHSFDNTLPVSAIFLTLYTISRYPLSVV